MKLNWSTMSSDAKKAFVSSYLHLSASEIAAQVNGASRNAIIGFCHRNRLQLARGKKAQHAADKKPPAAYCRPAKPSQEPKAKPDTNPVKEKISAAKETEASVEIEDEIEDIVEKVFGPVNIMHLTERTCRWPLNHTYIGIDVEEMMFCGHDSGYDSPWCPVHRKESFGGTYSGGRVVYANGERQMPRKVEKKSALLCRI